MKRLFFDLTATAVHGADHGVKDPNPEYTSLSVFTESFFLVVEKVKNVFKCWWGFLNCVFIIKQTNCGSTLHM